MKNIRNKKCKQLLHEGRDALIYDYKPLGERRPHTAVGGMGKVSSVGNDINFLGSRSRSSSADSVNAFMKQKLEKQKSLSKLRLSGFEKKLNDITKKQQKKKPYLRVRRASFMMSTASSVQNSVRNDEAASTASRKRGSGSKDKKTDKKMELGAPRGKH